MSPTFIFGRVSHQPPDDRSKMFFTDKHGDLWLVDPRKVLAQCISWEEIGDPMHWKKAQTAWGPMTPTESTPQR